MGEYCFIGRYLIFQNQHVTMKSHLRKFSLQNRQQHTKYTKGIPERSFVVENQVLTSKKNYSAAKSKAAQKNI